MGRHAGHRDIEPLQSQRPGDHTNGLALVLEDRPLFDMRFEIGRELAGAIGIVPDVANRRERFARGDAVDIRSRQASSRVS